LLADVGVESTSEIIDALAAGMSESRQVTSEDTLALLHERMVSILNKIESPLVIPDPAVKPFTILVIGVNGAGKTTTIGKLAKVFREHKIMLAAGDTFRAAAVDQLKSWGDRNQVPVISGAPGSDSAAVIYDALRAAREYGADILIADTAGRLQNKNNLVDELKKIRNTITKFDPELGLETLLVLDAGTGQNALVQAREFHREIGVTGIVLTKLDGTAKGGIVFALASKLGIPLRYVGTGEGIGDISVFKSEDFVRALLD
jgi:fused signal recognition particle receptor